MQTNCIFLASNFVIHRQILIFAVFKIANFSPFPILIANIIFHVTVLLLVYFCDQFVASEICHSRLQCLSRIDMEFSDEDKILIKHINTFSIHSYTRREINISALKMHFVCTSFHIC